MGQIEKEGVKPLKDWLDGNLPEVPRVNRIKRSGLVYTDRVTIVTGGNKGMGEGIAAVFVDAGAKVMICGRDTEAGQKVSHSLTERGPGHCLFQACDVSQPDQVRLVIDNTVKQFGQLDCLVNNAGYHPPQVPIDQFSVEDLKQVFATNFTSQFVGSQHALPHLRKTRGNIVNMSSCTALLGQEGATLYAATKGAICSFTKSLAIDEAHNGVRVNAVLPGNIYTESRAQLVKSMGAQGGELDRWADSMQQFGRSGTPFEAGQVCLFLASDAASYLTGLDIYISAGIELGVGVKYPPLFVTDD